jgi:hypothetical protein
MKIPKTFQIAGKTYRVTIDHKNELSSKGLIGNIIYSSCTIELSPTDTGNSRTHEDLEHTFLHEVWHGIWDALGDRAMKRDERRADAFCNLLHQVLNSGKGEIII